MGNFANLHIHSESSFLDGLSRVDEIAKRAADLGQPAVALTDHGEVNGHLAFQKACKDHDIHPVFGMEGYFTLDLNKSREDKTRGYDNSHITLLAKDQKGLENLWAWSSKAYEPNNFYYKPQADLKLMRDYAQGLYASDGCMLTEFARNVAKGDEPAAKEIIGKLLSVFGDNFYMELHPWQFVEPKTEEEISLTNEMKVLNLAKVRIANEFGIPLVVVNDAHYARPEQWENHALVWDFNTGKNSDQRGRGQTAAWMMAEDELIFWMSKHGVNRSVTEEAIKNSLMIAQSCTAVINPTLEMPRLSRSEQEDFATLEKAVEEAFAARIGDDDAYRERIDKELKVICDKGFAGYFNIVADYVKAAKSGVWRSYVSTGAQREQLLIGPGRGSAGGSLVAFLLGITSIDPIRYGLIFERFINPGRKDFPDIDVDVPQSRRSQLKEYLGARFGHDHVCHIGTRSRSAPKGMLADLCRVMKIGFTDRMAMSAIIEEVEDIAEDEALGWDEIIAERGGELAPWAKRYPGLFEKMGEMVGLARQAGTHASGILIANRPLLGTLPTRVKNGLVVSQFDMHEVEWLGAVKLDLLGLRHLDTLMVARDLIHETQGIWLDFEQFGDDEFNDSDIWSEMEKGQTVGIFQLETPGGTRVTKEFKPKSMTDVADLISVNRPGVIRAGLLSHYIRRRHGIEAVVYDHPLMQDIVGDTYGVLVYQEQLIQACQTLAGFSLMEADELRKLIGKKQIEKLGPMKEKFVAGCRNNENFMGVLTGRVDPMEVILKIWASFEAAGSYCFNKSHAIGYATIATWEIWTKHYYPKEFIVALMQTDSDNINKYVREARKRGIQILPPDINKSGRKFTLDSNGIRYGLDTVYGVGPSAVDDILENRPFGSLDDFMAKTTGRGAGKKSVVLNLIKIGAFDSIGDRKALMEDFCASRKDLANTPIPDFDDEKTVYEIEKELVGNYVTVDPMSKYVNALEAVCIQHPDDMKNFNINDLFYVGGMVTRIKHHKTKGGKDMAFLALSWNEQEFEIIAFPDAWSSAKNVLKIGVPVACQVIKLEKGCSLSTLERLDLVIA